MSVQARLRSPAASAVRSVLKPRDTLTVLGALHARRQAQGHDLHERRWVAGSTCLNRRSTHMT